MNAFSLEENHTPQTTNPARSPLPKDICEYYHKGNEHSEIANRMVAKVAQRRLILEALERRGEASCEELEVLTFLKHQSASARVSELKRDGLIVICGVSRTRSGSPCALYKLSSFGNHRPRGITTRGFHYLSTPFELKIQIPSCLENLP